MENDNEFKWSKYLCLISFAIVLFAIAFVMAFSSFENKIEEFFKENNEIEDAILESEIYELIDVDSPKNVGGVYEKEKNQLVEEYISTNGKISVFDKMLEKYTGEE